MMNLLALGGLLLALVRSGTRHCDSACCQITAAIWLVQLIVNPFFVRTLTPTSTYPTGPTSLVVGRVWEATGVMLEPLSHLFSERDGLLQGLSAAYAEPTLEPPTTFLKLVVWNNIPILYARCADPSF